jgi:hypothetical protein
MARNKRSEKRRNSPHRINVLSAHDDTFLGRLVNITTGGMMFLSPEHYETDQELDLRVPLPIMTDGRSAIEIVGRVVWQAPDSNPRYSRVGIQFTNLGAEEGYIIETILQRLHLVE